MNGNIAKESNMQNNKSSGGSQKVGNVNVQIGDKEGYYAGSASNMARLFIFSGIIWALVFIAFAYLNGVRIGNLESKVAYLEKVVK